MANPVDPQHDQFLELFVRHQDRVFAYIVSMVPQWRDAEDIFQQTSLILWKRWPDFDPHRDFLSWACGIAQNAARNYLRQASRDRLRFSEGLMETLGERRLSLNDVFEARREALGKCLDDLLPEHAALLRRCETTQSTLQDIAVSLGITANALYLKLRRIRQALFDCINRRVKAEERP